MVRYFIILFSSLLISLSFSFAFAAVEDFTTTQSLYHKDDQLNVFGNVSYDPEMPFVTIQIFTPGKSNFADFNTVPVNPDGSFSDVFHVGGPTWTSDGIYLIKVTYGGSMEKSIDYQESSTIPPAQEPETISVEDREIISPNPVTEPDSSFTILKSVIPNFPSLDKSPQHYIDRYNNEPKYQSWFDSKFPDISIYNILGYKDPISVPEWIRNNVGWWATGEITDSTFVTGIEFMLENDIIVISDVPSGNVSGDEIPVWIRNNAPWWSQDLISEDEFVNSLKFLILEGIIVIN